MPPIHSYPEAIEFLYGLQTFGMKFGLRGIRTLLRKHGDPHLRLRCIHIAGTNGKGSTAGMLASILTSAGFRTALYTSPHLVRFEERMRIDGRPIPRSALVRYTREIAPAVLEQGATFFEAVTAIAFRWFADQEVDIAVIETGLGGRLDATNVVHPLVSVITSIDLEHTRILGKTIRAIAREKAGIVKPRVPCVVGVHQPEALEVIRDACRLNRCTISHTDAVRHDLQSWGWEGSTAHMTTEDSRYASLRIALPGAHQIVNAAAALLVVDELRRRHHLRISVAAVRAGMANIPRLTGLRGRLSVVRRRPFLVADVAHNPAAMHVLEDTLEELHGCPAVFVIGVMGDKDLPAMARQLVPAIDEVIAVAARTERSLPAASVARVFQRMGVPVGMAPSVAVGLRRALRRAHGRTVVLTGSHFVVGEGLASLEGRNYLTISQ